MASECPKVGKLINRMRWIRTRNDRSVKRLLAHIARLRRRVGRGTTDVGRNIPGMGGSCFETVYAPTKAGVRLTHALAAKHFECYHPAPRGPLGGYDGHVGDRLRPKLADRYTHPSSVDGSKLVIHIYWRTAHG